MSFFTRIYRHLTTKKTAPDPVEGTKVLVIGLAKSGTSILMYRIANGLQKRREYFEPRGQKGQLDFDFHAHACQYTGNIVTKIVYHPNLPHALQDIMPLYDRVVWIVRDPRDQFISSFFYVWYKGHHPDPEKFQQALTLTRQKEAAPAATPFYELADILYKKKRFPKVYDPLIALLHQQQQQLFLLRYEDFIDGHLQELNDYLGFPIDEAAEVRERVNRVARSRAYGNWRHWFTPDDVAYYQEYVNPYLTALGYDPDDWALQPATTLSPQEGSEYMERMFAGG